MASFSTGRGSNLRPVGVPVLYLKFQSHNLCSESEQTRMLTRESFLELVRHEVGTIRHLAQRLPNGALDYQPSSAQRSLRELLQYLTVCAIVPCRAALEGNWDSAPAFRERAGTVTPDNFDSMMQLQLDELEALVSGVTHDELVQRDATLPWGTPCKLGYAFTVMGLQVLTAYRMQLFLYAKAAGNHELASANCWIGRDPVKQP